MAELHIDYHAVLEAFSRHTHRCPLCATIEEGERQFWDSTLYSSVGTEGFQDRFLRTRGFCPHHTRAFADQRDGVAITMLYAPLYRHHRRWLTEIQRPWRHNHRRRRSSAEEGGRTARRSDCLLCDRIERWTEMFARNLLRHQSNRELRTAVEHGRGLCLPHFRTVLETGRQGPFSIFRRIPTVSEWFIASHYDRWDAIVADAEKEAINRGGVAWKELLRMIEGDSVFPNGQER